MKQKSDDSRESSLEIVGVPGLEPGKTGPESVVLPITPYPNLGIFKMPSRRRCKSTHSHWNSQIIPRFFRAKFHFDGRTHSSARAALIHTGAHCAFHLRRCHRSRASCHTAHATKHHLLPLRAHPMGEVAFLIPEKQNSDGTCFGCRRCFEGQLPLRPKIEKCTYRFGWDFKSMSSESALVAVRFRRS